jgi:ferric-dicitrate binding protein FerR (iron transport regulator)
MSNEFDSSYNIAALIVKSLQNDLSAEESKILMQWKDAKNENLALFNELTTEESLSAELAIFDSFNATKDWEKVANKTVITNQAKISKFSRVFWLTSAAVLIFVLVGAFQFWKFTSNQKSNYTIQSKHNIVPGSNKATLTLADGTIILLNDSINGFHTKQQNVNLLIQNGEIKYQSLGQNEAPSYNTIITPNGGQYKLLLDDGTKVWLNASSSIKYPTTFSGKERIVTLTGEGYFEIAHNTQMPFKVILPNVGKVEAIGTIFNIKAYQDELQLSGRKQKGVERPPLDSRWTVHSDLDQAPALPKKSRGRPRKQPAA